MGNLNFDSSAVEPNVDISEPIPPGDYIVGIVESSVGATSRGDGVICKMTAEVMEGDYKGRKVFLNFNLRNPNKKAEEIGQGQLSALCRACGMLGLVADSSELHGIPFKARVKVQPGSGEYGPKNTITNYQNMVGQLKTTPTKTTAPAHKAQGDDMNW